VVADSAAIGSVRAAVAGLVDARAGADDDQLRRLVVPRVVVVGASRLPGEKDYDDLCAAGPTRAVGARDEESLAVLLYTSGTSGRPRAAMLSHRALLSNIEQVAAVEPTMIVGNDVVLAVLPLFHVYGLNAVLGQALRQGATLVLVDGFEAEGSLRVVEDHGVSVLPVAPPVFAAWVAIDDLERRLAGVRLVLSGSAPLPLEAVERFSARTGVAVHQGYGLTEAAPVVTSTLCSASLKVGSVGRALPGVTLRLVDGAGRAAEGEDVGEVELRGDNLFSGYWPDGVDGPAADGWWRTGDVGYLDADGDLFLVDRLRELVIVSGFNVYPREVEEVVSEVAGVAESGVIGVDDPVTGEAVVAYVRPRAESTLSAEQLAAAVHDHCRRRLAPFKRPSAVHVVAELPHTVTGKVAKGELRGTERRRTLGLLA
jgi:long-chain acyl-CoA synthetase